MIVRITVNTPKNQAAKCVNSQKAYLVGSKHTVLESKVVRHDQYYLVVETEDVESVTARCAKAEVMIRAFYRSLIKWVQRANTLCRKFDKGVVWVRRYLVAQAQRLYGESGAGMIRSMSDDEIRDVLRITDLEEMRRFLDGDLITVEVLPCSEEKRNRKSQ